MKFIFFVEGYTENNIVPSFFRRVLNYPSHSLVGVKAVRFEGCSDFVKHFKKKAEMYLNSPKNKDIIAVVGLLDLYGLPIIPDNIYNVDDKVKWGRKHFQDIIGDDRFKMFFSIHEVESWLFSSPSIFPKEVQKSINALSRNPEQINFENPPAERLNAIYNKNLKKGYKKVEYGTQLFECLDPLVVRQKCPYFKQMVDELNSLI